ncbi:rhomboid family intramembrane serine protease [Bacteroidota bacterium]
MNSFNPYNSPLEGLKKFFRSKSILVRLIIINTLVFLAINFIKIIFFLFQINPYIDEFSQISKTIYWLAVPADFNALLLKPWTIITYMFLQENLLHIFFNMFMLYFGGQIFVKYLGEKRLISTYLFGGIAGAIFYIASFNIFPAFQNAIHYSLALGASASVLAILIAISSYIPDFSINLLLLGKIKLKYIAVFIVVIDILSIDKGNAGGHLAHLGGAFFGFTYIKLMKSGIHLPVIDFTGLFKRKSAYTKFTTIKNEKKRPLSDEEYNKIKLENQKRIDHILEKISKSGYESLTKEEKELLFNMSNKK